MGVEMWASVASFLKCRYRYNKNREIIAHVNVGEVIIPSYSPQNTS